MHRRTHPSRQSMLLLIGTVLVSLVAGCGRTDGATQTAPTPTPAPPAAAYPAPPLR